MKPLYIVLYVFCFPFDHLFFLCVTETVKWCILSTGDNCKDRGTFMF